VFLSNKTTHAVRTKISKLYMAHMTEYISFANDRLYMHQIQLKIRLCKYPEDHNVLLWRQALQFFGCVFMAVLSMGVLLLKNTNKHRETYTNCLMLHFQTVCT